MYIRDLQDTITKQQNQITAMTSVLKQIQEVADQNTVVYSEFIRKLIQTVLPSPLKLQNIITVDNGISVRFNRQLTDEEVEQLADMLKADGAPWL